MFEARRGFRPRIRTSHVVAGAALVLITTGGATAAGMITGKNIKDGSVSTKDVKNGSLLLKDFKASERSKLVGPAGPAGTAGTTGGAGAKGANGTAGTNGTNGTNGAPGASAFGPLPSGTVIKGGGILNVTISAGGIALRSFAPLPFTTTAPLTNSGTGRNLWFGSENAATLPAAEMNAGSCPGTASAPNPTTGNMCVYVKEVGNISVGGAFLYPGADISTDAADSNGFYAYATSNAAGPMLFRYVWAYKAP